MLRTLIGAVLAYSLSHPAQTFELPKALSEVSGLSWSAKGTIWAVGDERGTLFELSPKNGEVLRKVEFHRRGDFESVEEISPNKVIAAKSDGQLFEIDPEHPDQATHFDAGLGAMCDLEGIAWLPAKKRLLLACKNEVLGKGGFAIQALDLETKKLDEKPFAVLSLKQVKDWVDQHRDDKGVKQAKARNFGPSGLAVHPKTGEVYIVSSPGRMVVILGADGSLKQIEGLDRDVHRHPEGICFAPDGTLFISNEAAGGRPVLQRFDGPQS